MVLELQKGIILLMHSVGVARLDVHQRVHKENNMYLYNVINNYEIDAPELLMQLICKMLNKE